MKGQSLGHRASVLAVSLALATAACDGNESVVGLDAQFDAGSMAQVLEGFMASTNGDVTAVYLPIVGDVILYSGVPSASISPAPGEELTRGHHSRLAVRRLLERSLDRARASMPEARAALASNGRVIPTDLLGKTFVMEPLKGYVIDKQRVNAPADGVRFETYELDEVTRRPKTMPLERYGHLDLMDQSGETLRLGVHSMRDNGVEIADFFIEGTYSISDQELISDFRSEGTLGEGGRVEYALRDLFAFTDGLQQLEVIFERDVSLPEKNRSVSVSLTGVLTQDPEDPGLLTLSLSLADGSNTATLEASMTEVEVDGTLTHNGETVVLISGDPIEPTYRRPDGTTLEGGQFRAMDRAWVASDQLLLFGDAMVAGVTFLFQEDGS